MEIYGRIRRAVLVEGKSERTVAREFGVARETVRKMLRYAVPPGYRRQQPPKRPKLGPRVGVIDAILENDKQQPKKQRHTAKRIFERLRSEHAYTGGYTIREGLRAGRDAAPPEDVRSAEACSGHGAGRLRRGAGDRRWRGAEGALLRDRPAALRRLLRPGVSGGDDGSVPGRPRSGLLRFLRERADASLHATQHLARDCSDAYGVVRTIGLSHSVSERFARFLLETAAEGEVSNGTVRVRLAMTHEEILQLVGTSRETITRLLSEFRRHQMAELKGSTLIIRNRPALKHMVGA